MECFVHYFMNYNCTCVRSTTIDNFALDQTSLDKKQSSRLHSTRWPNDLDISLNMHVERCIVKSRERLARALYNFVLLLLLFCLLFPSLLLFPFYTAFSSAVERSNLYAREGQFLRAERARRKIFWGRSLQTPIILSLTQRPWSSEIFPARTAPESKHFECHSTRSLGLLPTLCIFT